MAKTNAELQAENAKLKEELETLQKKIKELEEENEAFGRNLDACCEVGSEPITRNDVIKAMLPQIRVKFPRSDTQDLMRAVDEVLETINA